MYNIAVGSSVLGLVVILWAGYDRMKAFRRGLTEKETKGISTRFIIGAILFFGGIGLGLLSQ